MRDVFIPRPLIDCAYKSLALKSEERSRFQIGGSDDFSSSSIHSSGELVSHTTSGGVSFLRSPRFHLFFRILIIDFFMIGTLALNRHDYSLSGRQFSEEVMSCGGRISSSRTNDILSLIGGRLWGIIVSFTGIGGGGDIDEIPVGNL